jgi:hypothetical protein
VRATSTTSAPPVPSSKRYAARSRRTVTAGFSTTMRVDADAGMPTV